MILLDDGKVKLKVLEHGRDFAETRVLAGHGLSNNKGLNLPGLAIPIPALTDKDRKDVVFALEQGQRLHAAMLRKASRWRSILWKVAIT